MKAAMMTLAYQEKLVKITIDKEAVNTAWSQKKTSIQHRHPSYLHSW
jgi:hypothetical protein